MRKSILYFLLFLISTNTFCEDLNFRSICKFNNGIDENDLLIRKPENVEEDDITGNVIKISLDGEIFIHCRDKREIYEFDIINKKIISKCNSRFLPQENFAIFTDVIKNSFLFCGFNGRAYLIDFNNNLKFSVDMLYDWGFQVNFDTGYYDKESDILFFKENEKINSIIHPGLDTKENLKNYKTSEETKAKIQNGEYGDKFTLNNKGNLMINGKIFRWGNAIELSNSSICVINTILPYINYYDGKQRHKLYYKLPDGEELESYTWHPSGDAYFLTINWKSNVHTLWYIENTWDPEWREQWYKEHPDAVRPE